MRTLVSKAYRRLFKPTPSNEEKVLQRLKKIQSRNRISTPPPDAELQIANNCILIPAFRIDGIGIQFMVRVSTMQLAHQAKATYVHLPFWQVEHQQIDPIGKALNQEASLQLPKQGISNDTF